jgi:hypothetical protein
VGLLLLLLLLLAARVPGRHQQRGGGHHQLSAPLSDRLCRCLQQKRPGSYSLGPSSSSSSSSSSCIGRYRQRQVTKAAALVTARNGAAGYKAAAAGAAAQCPPWLQEHPTATHQLVKGPHKYLHLLVLLLRAAEAAAQVLCVPAAVQLAVHSGLRAQEVRSVRKTLAPAKK